MGRLTTVLLELFLANESDDDGDGVVECAIDVGGWDGALAKTQVTVTMEMRRSSLDKFGIKTVIRIATVISQSSRHPVSAGWLCDQCRRLQR